MFNNKKFKHTLLLFSYIKTIKGDSEFGFIILISEFEYSVFEKCDQGDLKQHLKQLRYSSENPPNVTFSTKSTELITHALDVLAGIIYLKEKKVWCIVCILSTSTKKLFKVFEIPY